MKMFKVFVDEGEYDTYDAFVVVAKDEEEAKKLVLKKAEDPLEVSSMELFLSHKIIVEEITLDKPRLILESFNRG